MKKHVVEIAFAIVLGACLLYYLFNLPRTKPEDYWPVWLMG